MLMNIRIKPFHSVKYSAKRSMPRQLIAPGVISINTLIWGFRKVVRVPITVGDLISRQLKRSAISSRQSTMLGKTSFKQSGGNRLRFLLRSNQRRMIASRMAETSPTAASPRKRCPADIRSCEYMTQAQRNIYPGNLR